MGKKGKNKTDGANGEVQQAPRAMTLASFMNFPSLGAKPSAPTADPAPPPGNFPALGSSSLGGSNGSAVAAVGAGLGALNFSTAAAGPISDPRVLNAPTVAEPTTSRPPGSVAGKPESV
eukprot:8170536-Pyramimonas_sp.AAC.1